MDVNDPLDRQCDSSLYQNDLEEWFLALTEEIYNKMRIYITPYEMDEFEVYFGRNMTFSEVIKSHYGLN